MVKSIDEDSESKLVISREQGFFDRSLIMRLIIILIFTVCLFIFLHFREVRVEVLEPNSIAKHYVIAQIDFDFPDDESTILLKQRAIRDVDRVYKISDKEILRVRLAFENELIDKYSWRKQTNTSLEDMNKGGDLIEGALFAARFTSKDLLEKMEEQHYSSKNFYILIPSELEETINIPEDLWNQIAANTFANSGLNSKAKRFIISYFEQNNWGFEEDKAEELKIKQLIQSSVPQQYTTIRLGKHIINQGDIVTSRHISMMQAMKEGLNKNRNLLTPLSFIGSVLMTLLFIVIGWLYFKFNHPELLVSNRQLSLLVSIVILTLAVAKLIEAFLVISNNSLIEDIGYPLFVPLAAILLCSLMNHRLAIFTCGFLAVVMSMTLAVDRIEFLVINLVASIVAIMASRSLRQRKEIFWVMAKAWFSCIVVIIAFNLSENSFYATPIITGIISSFVFLLVTAILVVGLLPLLESIFHVLTDIILMEYMNPHNELLRKLAIEAPGTYQHSIVVGFLSEAAANEIGANGLFCRVAALYHDIGKISNPQYFTENQQRGIDMHQLLTPIESARVIIAHVSDGVSMARKASLPEPIIDILKEHHGTTSVYFFYHKQVELMGGDSSAVDREEFRYAGPRPYTKESAILMIADSLEAASRSLDVINEESVSKLLDNLLDMKAKENQFDECQLTFQELQIVRKILINTMVTSSHSRVKYPKQEEKVST